MKRLTISLSDDNYNYIQKKSEQSMAKTINEIIQNESTSQQIISKLDLLIAKSGEPKNANYENTLKDFIGQFLGCFDENDFVDFGKVKSLKPVALAIKKELE